MAARNEPEPLDRETMVVAGVVLLGAIMSILDTTVINVAIDHLAVAFNASLTTIQWVITGYTLALAAVIPVSGWAADRFGTKRIYMTSLVLFTLGSIASGLSWSAESMIVFRVLQGIGGGLIMPTVMTIMTKKAGPHRMGRVMGVLGVPMLIAPIMGPILGGWLVADVSWRWIFFINVPIGVVAFILALIVLDRDQPQPAHRLDWLGMLLLSPGLAVFIYGLAESSTYGFGSPHSWAPTAIGVLLIAAWFVHSWRTPEPLIDVRTFVHTRAGYAGASFFLFAISVFGTMLLVPLYYQTVRGTSALQAGLLLAPGGFGAMLLMPVSGTAHRPLRTNLATGHRAAPGRDRTDPVRVRRRHHFLRAPVRRELRPGARHGVVDDAEHDGRDAGGAAFRDRPHEHRDEHHPPGGRLNRHSDTVGHPRLRDHQQPRVGRRRAHVALGLWRARGAAAPARRSTHPRRHPARERVRIDVRVGARDDPDRAHPGGRDGAQRVARPTPAPGSRPRARGRVVGRQSPAPRSRNRRASGGSVQERTHPSASCGVGRRARRGDLRPIASSEGGPGRPAACQSRQIRRARPPSSQTAPKATRFAPNRAARVRFAAFVMLAAPPFSPPRRSKADAREGGPCPIVVPSTSLRHRQPGPVTRRAPPPSARIVSPLMYVLGSESRNSTTSAISWVSLKALERNLFDELLLAA